MSSLETLRRSVDAPWREQAACQNAASAVFFPPVGGNADAARTICAGCPVQEPCLDEALNVSPCDDHGIWGGTSPGQRLRLRRKLGIRPESFAQAREQQTHGTAAAAADERAAYRPVCGERGCGRKVHTAGLCRGHARLDAAS